MSLLSLQNIQIAFGGPPLLAGLSLDIQKGERICILGRNGAGKSTLLRIMSGQLKPDAGSVILSPGLHVAYLEQNVPETISGTAFEIVAAGAGPAGKALAAYHRELAAPTDPEHLHQLQHELNHLEGWKIEPLVKRVLTQVEVSPEAPFASLSGGMRRRVFLARALVQEPDLLLLDEPTNHLDLASIAWLETFLVSSRLTTVFVTHDRRLLRKLATRIELRLPHLPGAQTGRPGHRGKRMEAVRQKARPGRSLDPPGDPGAAHPQRRARARAQGHARTAAQAA
jgi:ATP-binding cassette subfamily F protein uup